jgi:hypothetical protein
MVAGGAIVHVLWAAWIIPAEYQRKGAPPPDLTARVEALERRADEALKIRCMRVEAGRLDMMIIPVENVGRKP